MRRSDKVHRVVAVVIIVVIALMPFAVSWYWHFYWDADPKIQSVLPRLPDCYVPPDVAVDGVAYASVQSWDDLNADGVRNTGEVPLRDVVVMMVQDDYVYDNQNPPISWNQIMSSQYDVHEFLQVTDKNGEALLSDFRPGCACNCWKGISVVAWGPEGYEGTTPALVSLSKDNQAVTFGFSEFKQVSH